MRRPPAPVAQIEDRHLAGVALALTAYLLFTGIDSCAKWLVLAGVPSTEVVFVRFAVHLALAMAIILPRSGVGLFATKNLRLEILRALCLLAATMLNFIAVRYLPLTLTSAILLTSPLWVCMLSIPLLGEKVGPRRWAAILVGFGGVLIATRPWSAEAHWAALLSLAMAIFAALYAILTRRLSGQDSVATQQLYAAFVATLGVAPLAFTNWTWPTAGADWIAFALIGVFGWSGHQMLTLAHRFAPASVLAPFNYALLPFMAVSSLIVFAQPPSEWVLGGGAVVILSGLYVWMRERRLAEEARK